MIKLILVVKFVTILMFSILLSIIFVELCSERYIQVAEDYPHNSTSLTLSNVTESRQNQALRVLTAYVDDHNLFLTRADQILTREGCMGTKIGVYGSPNAQSQNLGLTFMGQPILNAEKLSTLLNASSGSATLGLSVSRTDMMEDLPSFAVGNKLVIEKLSYLAEESGTVNATYHICGLTPEQETELVQRLAEASGTSSEEILNPLSGHARMSVITLILPPIALVAAGLLLALFVVSNLFALRELGASITCGWTRVEFTLYKSYGWVLFSLISIPITVAVGMWATKGTLFSYDYFSFIGIAALLVVITTIICVIIAAILVLRVPPVDAIRNRISRRVLVVLLVIAYLVCATFTDFSGFILDGPMDQLNANNEISRQWSSVSDLNILEKVNVGKDAASISGQSDRLSQKFYEWYSSIADEEGVYLVNASYIGENGFQSFKALNPSLNPPDAPIFQYVASPRYLETQNFQIDPALIKAAHAGTRVYFLPDTMSQDERQKVETYLRSDDNREGNLSSDIQTAFNKNREFSFSTYTPHANFFCWDADISHPQMQNNPVISVCVPENMIFREAMSLNAIGLSSSYIKLSDQAVSNYLNPEYLAKYELADNKPTFVSTAEFVAGLQKALGETISMFGSVALLAMLLMLAMVLGLTAAYQVTYHEEIAAKRFLGYSLWSMYRLPFIVVFSTFLISELVVVLLHSKLGIALVAVLVVVQFVVLFSYIASRESKCINRMLKE